MDAFIQDLEQGQISRNQGDCTQSTHGPEPRPLSTTYVNHCTNFNKLHVMAKKLQSVQSDNNFENSITELENCDFDILLVSEGWRDKREQVIVTAAGQKVSLGGGSRNGVGTCVSRRLLDQISGLTFFTISEKICSAHCTKGHHHFHTFSCYMLPSGEPDDAADHVHDLLGVLLFFFLRSLSNHQL